jgi:hypothetical protein
MTAHLRPCPGCSRHVRVSEGACPFCGVSLDPSFRATPAPVGPSRRLSRAALFAFGTGTLVLSPVAAIDCGNNIAPQPLYGGAFLEDSGEVSQDSSFVLADVQVGSVDAGDSSALDAGSPVDASNDAETDGAASDAESNAGDAD